MAGVAPEEGEGESEGSGSGIDSAILRREGEAEGEAMDVVDDVDDVDGDDRLAACKEKCQYNLCGKKKRRHQTHTAETEMLSGTAPEKRENRREIKAKVTFKILSLMSRFA